MKKWLSLLAVVMAVCLLPVCAMGEEYETDDVQKQYQFKKSGTFTFDTSKYKEGYRFYVNSDGVKLIFNNVDIECRGTISVLSYNKLDIVMNGGSITSVDDNDGEATAISTEGLSLTGSGTIRGGEGEMTASAIDSRNLSWSLVQNASGLPTP